MNRTFDRYAGIVFLLLGAGFVWESRKIGTSAYGSNVGPEVFPTILGSLLVLLSLRLLYETVKSKPAEKQNGNGDGEKPDYVRLGLIFGSALVYVLILEPVGYVISTFVFLLIGFQIIERGKWLQSVLISACFSAAVYLLFVELLEGSLPGFPAWLGL
jgi:putative tricarboxylic transport membrane protein